MMKVERKANLGAEFIQTQAVYDIELAKRFMTEVEHLGIPVLIGIAPFRTIAMMEWMTKHMPGIVVPEEIQARLRNAGEKRGEKGLCEENVDFFGNSYGISERRPRLKEYT